MLGLVPGPRLGRRPATWSRPTTRRAHLAVLLDLGNGALGAAAAATCDPHDVDAVAVATCTPTTASTSCVLTSRCGTARRPVPAGAGARPGRHGGAARARYGLATRRRSMTAEFDVREWRPGAPVRVGPLVLVPVAGSSTRSRRYGMRVAGPTSTTRPPVTLAYSGDTDACAASTRWRPAPTCCCPRPRSTRAATTPVRGVHLTGRRAGEAAAAAGRGAWCSRTSRRGTTPSVTLAEARRRTHGPSRWPAPGATYDALRRGGGPGVPRAGRLGSA